MKISKFDVLSSCPTQAWTDNKFKVTLTLANGHILVVSFDLDSLRTFRMTAQLAQERFLDALSGCSLKTTQYIADCFNEQFMLVAQDQLAISRTALSILEGIGADALSAQDINEMTDRLAVLLTPYEPAASHAGWSRFIENCFDYADTI